MNRFCPSCGSPADAQARFCGQCGHALDPVAPALDGERKQLTVLVADVKGSMNLQEDLDPEEWAGVMDGYVRVLADGVHRFGGTVDRFTGDGIVAFFGAPVALEDHAHRACYAALDLARSITTYAEELRGRGIPDFLVRIGLNSGEAVVGHLGAGLDLDATALGHTVGLAERMQTLAVPGRACMSEHAARLVRGAFRLSERGPQTIDGEHEPVRVFDLEGTLPRAPVRSTTPLVGREGELAVLHEAFMRASQGEARVLAVIGEAGVGKSRLCDDFVAALAAGGVVVHRTAGVSHGRGLPLLPMLALVRDYFDVTEADSPPEVRAVVERRLRALDPALADDVPLLFDFLEVPDPARPAPPLAADVRMRRLFEFLRRVTGRRSAREVLVLLVEDLHWFDPQSEAFLQQLLESFAGTRTLAIVNFRPGYRAPWMALPYYRELPLPRLPDVAVGKLLGGMLGVDPSLAPLVAFVSDQTGGNPFFVEEVVRDLLEDGTLAGTPGAYRLTRPLQEIHVPPSVHAVLAARIDRLAPDQKALLQTASVIGRTFSAPVLRRVAGAGDELADVLGGLCDAELLQPVAEFPVAEFRFWHPLTQEVAYGTLLARRRADLHARVAEALVEHHRDGLDEHAAELAWHWEQAGNRLEAARWNLRAAGFAMRSDLGEALRRWQATVVLLDGIDETPDALTLGVQARIRRLQFGARTGIGPEEARRLEREARQGAERLGHVGLQGLVAMAAGSAAVLRGEVVAGLDLYLDAARLGELTGDVQWQATLSLPPPIALTWVGPLPDALALNDRTLRACAGDVECGVGVLGYSVLGRALQIRAAVLALVGRLVEAGEALDRSIRMARPRGEPDTLCWALALATRLGWLAGTEVDMGPAAECVRLAEDTRNMPGLVLGLESVALAHLGAGRPEDAAAACRRALDEAHRQGSGLFEEALVLGVLGLAELAAGHPAAAATAADEAVAVARRRKLRVPEVQGLLVRARVAFETGGGHDAVLSDLRAAAPLVRETGATTYEPVLREALARLDGDDAQLREARRLYAAAGAAGHARRLDEELAGAVR